METVQCSLLVCSRDTGRRATHHGWTAGLSDLNAVQSFWHTFYVGGARVRGAGENRSLKAAPSGPRATSDHPPLEELLPSVHSTELA